MMKLVIGLMLAIGIWQLGGGVYIHGKALLAQELLQRSWDRSLQGEERATPWPWADTWPMARLVIPEYDIDQIVLASATGRTMAFGPGYMQGSAYPGRNESTLVGGSTIVSGHRDTHFAFLKQLREGDHIQLQTVDGALHSYQVAFALVTDRDRLLLADDDREDLLVLVTCYPFEGLMPGTPYRYQVVAKKVIPGVLEEGVTMTKIPGTVRENRQDPPI